MQATRVGRRGVIWGAVPFALVAIAACSSSNGGSGFASDGDAGAVATGIDGGETSDGASSVDSGPLPRFEAGGGGTPGSGGCVVTDKNADMDKDGWSTAQGDCNDCDPNVNPGAIDVLHPNDGGAPTWGDEDCDGTPGDSALPCDTGLALASVDPNDAAKSIELCRQATATDRKYGVLSATYVRADGTPYATPGLQVGIKSAFGSNVHPQGGANLFVLSSGHARAVGDPGACNSVTCITNQTATPPTGFPQNDPACPIVDTIFDDIALEVKIRVPTNATGFSFDFKFHSFEYPNYVCEKSGWNDEFVALVSPPPAGSYVPAGSQLGNISFDGNKHPVSVNMGFFDVCDPSTPQRFAANCNNSGGPCPPLPTPYCPLGLGELAGTGFDSWHSSVGPAGATRWLRSQAPATGGSTITVRFAIWDAGNAQFDSTALVDNFQWIATPGVAVSTQPPPAPK